MQCEVETFMSCELCLLCYCGTVCHMQLKYMYISTHVAHVMSIMLHGGTCMKPV